MTVVGSIIKTLKKSVTSPRFWATILLGQFLALCITTTNVTTRLMSMNYSMDIPTTQSLGNYLILAILFTSYTIYRYGIRDYLDTIKQRGLFYLVLSVVDVEANYFIVKGFAKTNFLSAMLINACSTPGVVLLSYLFLKTRYLWTHLVGVCLAVSGLGLLILSDIITDKGYEGQSPLIGDLYCVIAALLYAVSNTLEEFFVRKHPNWEILGFLGLFGSIINLIQLFILERGEFQVIVWNKDTIGLYIGFTLAMFCLYSLVPVLIGVTNATFYNISLLTSDFYGLIMGLFLFQAKTHPLYPGAFVLVMLGLLLFNFRPAHSKFSPLVESTDLVDPPPYSSSSTSAVTKV